MSENEKKNGAGAEVHPREFAAAEAEKALLGCVIQNPERCMGAVMQRVTVPEVFTDLTMRELWRVLLDLTKAGKPVDDPVAISQVMSERHPNHVGMRDAAVEAFAATGVTSRWEVYLDTLMEKFHLRRLREVGAEVRDLAEMAATKGAIERPVSEVVAEAESRVFKLLQEVESQSETEGPKPASVGVMEWVDGMEATIRSRAEGGVTGLTTGIHEIDRVFSGFDDTEGELVVIAGRPGQGKTAMACTLLQHFGLNNIPGVFFSAEMAANQIYNRLILGGADIELGKAFTGHFSEHDQMVMGTQVKKVAGWPMWIDDSARISTADIRMRTQLWHRREGIRWIVVDHLHKVKGVEKGSEEERIRLVEVNETLRYLKKELGLVVFNLVQLNRESDKNAGKPPTLSDLAGSGSTEQDADHVIFIHRPPYFVDWRRLSQANQEEWEDLVTPRRKRCPDLWSDGQKWGADEGGAPRQDYEEDAILFVRKNRRGPTPELHIRFEGEKSRFSTRMPQIQSDNILDAQIGSYKPERLKRPAKDEGRRGGYRRDHDDFED
jgi:replicative DNA helicase